MLYDIGELLLCNLVAIPLSILLLSFIGRVCFRVAFFQLLPTIIFIDFLLFALVIYQGIKVGRALDIK